MIGKSWDYSIFRTQDIMEGQSTKLVVSQLYSLNCSFLRYINHGSLSASHIGRA
jgi:hypothetical protein